MVFLSTSKAPVRRCHSDQGDGGTRSLECCVPCSPCSVPIHNPSQCHARSHQLRMPYSRFDIPLCRRDLRLVLLVTLPRCSSYLAAAAPAMESALHLSSVFHHAPCSLTPPHLSFLTNAGSSSTSSLMRNAVAPGLLQRHAAAAAAAAPLGLSCSASACGPSDALVMSRRQLSVVTLLVTTFGTVAGARADAEEDYKRETSDVIEQVRTTLALEKTDPSKAAAVAKLRQAGNDWVAKYRKAKKVAGKPSFSNMYSVINAISGHFVSFGATYPIPAKRKDRILDEMKDAEKALSRGR